MNKMNKILTPLRMSIFIYIIVLMDVLLGNSTSWLTLVMLAMPCLYWGIDLYFANNLTYMRYELYLMRNDWHNRKYLY